jgi:NADH dehydrogenase FAD-containing subunit
MQIEDSSMLSPHIFALGDVAKTLGPRMARAARAQADVVTSNILAMINKQNPTAIYRPQIYEGAIKLTLGKVISYRATICIYCFRSSH